MSQTASEARGGLVPVLIAVGSVLLGFLIVFGAVQAIVGSQGPKDDFALQNGHANFVQPSEMIKYGAK